ncbi:SAF domain-containing protein [Streptomyces sp. CA-250714]|uniref:SAF domain-containing protein n=1 Tax=Streptomyces sp. CA-250714 TaxID=3240060 RepID=UPI003D8A1291
MAPSTGGRRKTPIRWSGLALCVLLAVVGALVVVVAVSRAGDRVSVLVVSKDVPAGERLTGSDVQVASIAKDPAVATLDSSQRASVVGKRVAVDLRKGSLLSDAQLTPGGGLGDDQQLVGVEVKRGQAPRNALKPGDRVLAVTIPAQGEDVSSGETAKDPESVEAQVVSVGPPDASGAMTVNVAVDPSEGPGLRRRPPPSSWRSCVSRGAERC